MPFISGKDSSSGTFEAAGKKIEVPPTLAVAAVARVSDVKTVVTKEFKGAGNSLVLVGRFDPEALGGRSMRIVSGSAVTGFLTLTMPPPSVALGRAARASRGRRLCLRLGDR